MKRTTCAVKATATPRPRTATNPQARTYATDAAATVEPVTIASLQAALTVTERKLKATENAVQGWKATAERSSRLYHAAQALTVRQAERIGVQADALYRWRYELKAAQDANARALAASATADRWQAVQLVCAVLAGALATLAAIYSPLSAVLS